ncbi:hypothetical protein NCY98_19410, partial [Phocaeicola vulgatus]|nr:hypothetical protein [Phocaeicola vulgatus]
MRRYHAVFVQKNKYTLRTWQTEDAHSLVQELNNKMAGGDLGSPDKSGGKFFNSIENLHLCTMNNQGLLALAQLILPSEILSN